MWRPNSQNKKTIYKTVILNRDIKQYIEQFPNEVQQKLLELHFVLKEVLPLATETISYKMPAFKQNKILVYYAGYKNHIGFYPTAEPIVKFENDLKAYKYSKGAIQFSLHEELPKQLIQKIALYRLSQIVK